MLIKRFEITGLFDREKIISGDLHSDLNIITGRNGAGKTTILKSLWYIMSGNILLLLQEVPFSRVTLWTDNYTCSVIRLGPNTCKVELDDGKRRIVFEDVVDHDGDVIENAEDHANTYLQARGGSVFFPTFRRIEGGFSLNRKRTANNALLSSSWGMTRQKNDVEDALVQLSRELTNEAHRFVSSIATTDISALLIRQFADLSELANKKQTDVSQNIIDQIRQYRSEFGEKSIADAEAALDIIKVMIETMDSERVQLMNPINAVREVVEGIFRNTRIQFGERLSFGEAANAVSSDLLSAGEKQMLSFICYNAFYRDCVFFIDEPELSLHTDWQRSLFSVLSKQGTNNQFIMATHSPFIYSKYPEKEIMLADDRGDSESIR